LNKLAQAAGLYPWNPTNGATMQELAARLARGEEAAFAELYDACADRLLYYLTARTLSREGAADVLQTVFLRAVQSRRRFRGVENPVAYLYQIARNEASRAMRRDCGRPAQMLPATEAACEASDAFDRRDDAELVTAALARLDVADREIVELKTYGGLTFGEIAVVVGRPSATVATQYRRALQSLRGWLARQLG
jgi:RNA polymerase sigma-70 factor, ECF subfamily